MKHLVKARMGALLLASALSAAATAGAAAQDSPDGESGAQQPSQQQVAAARLPSLDRVRVDSVRILRPHRFHWHADGERVYARIGDIIFVRVLDLRSLIANALCMDSSLTGNVNNCRPREVALFLDDREIADLEPETKLIRHSLDDGWLRFHLARSVESDEAWADLLGRPVPGGGERFVQRAEVTVGLSGGPGFLSAGAPLSLHFEQFTRLGGILVLLVLAGTAGSLVMLDRKTDIFRDPGPEVHRGRKTYSLGRVQMGLWFVLVVSAFVFIGLVTRNWDSINATALVLIGVSGATLIASAALDARREAAAERLPESTEQLANEVLAFEARVAALKAKGATATSEERAEYAEALATFKRKSAELARLEGASRGLLHDLLADESGYGFHRFQMVVWTVVLAGLFVASVWDRLAMPEFSATLLSLMGISAGTYVGFKTGKPPSQQSVHATPTQPAPPTQPAG